MSRRPIRPKDIFNPDRIISNLYKDYIEGNLDPFPFLYRAIVVAIDPIGGQLEKDPPCPRYSIKARVITNARDKDLEVDDLPIFWPVFSHDIMPLKEGEHVYVTWEDLNEKRHGLWLTRVPEPKNVESSNLVLGKTKYEQNNEGTTSTVGVEQVAQDTDRQSNTPETSPEFKVEQVQPFRARVGDRVIEGSNNTLIVLGRDRPSDENSGETDLAGTIDIVSGRSTPENMDMVGDKSRIYISSNTAGDKNFQLDSIGDDGGSAAVIVVKSDQIRIVARKNMKIVVEGGDLQINTSGKITEESENLEVNTSKLTELRSEELSIDTSKKTLLRNENFELLASDHVLVDAKKNIDVNASEKTTIEGKTINVGKDANKSMVLGEDLKDILSKILNALNTHIHPTTSPGAPTGPVTPPNPDLITATAALETILSKTVKVKA